MKKMILTLMVIFAVSPAIAQENMTFGHENNARSYRVVKVPRKSVVVVRRPQQATANCQMPSGLINKSIDDINGMRFNRPVRIIHPGEPVTQDYQEDRINIMLDEQGIIRGLRCG